MSNRLKAFKGRHKRSSGETLKMPFQMCPAVKDTFEECNGKKTPADKEVTYIANSEFKKIKQFIVIFRQCFILFLDLTFLKM